MNQIQTYQELIEWAESKKFNKKEHEKDCCYQSERCDCGLLERMIYDKALEDLISYLKGRIEEVKSETKELK